MPIRLCGCIVWPATSVFPYNKVRFHDNVYNIPLPVPATVVPAKSDSDIMVCLQSYRDLESIDHLCINPIHRIGLIHK